MWIGGEVSLLDAASRGSNEVKRAPAQLVATFWYPGERKTKVFARSELTRPRRRSNIEMWPATEHRKIGPSRWYQVAALYDLWLLVPMRRAKRCPLWGRSTELIFLYFFFSFWGENVGDFWTYRLTEKHWVGRVATWGCFQWGWERIGPCRSFHAARERARGRITHTRTGTEHNSPDDSRTCSSAGTGLAGPSFHSWLVTLSEPPDGLGFRACLPSWFHVSVSEPSLQRPPPPPPSRLFESPTYTCIANTAERAVPH